MRCLRSLLRITWRDKVPDTEVLRRANSESIHAMLLRSRLRWAGHIYRMSDSRLPKRLLYGELSSGERSVGRPKKRFKDTLKESLGHCGVPHSSWEETAGDRPAWRAIVKTGVARFEANRIRTKEKRQRRKNQASSIPQPGSAPTIPCPHCNRLFRAQIGLISHLRTHVIPR